MHFRERHRIGENEGREARSLVSLYVYRKYVLNYLQNSPYVHDDLLQMVRMLQPTAEGIPIEENCFTQETNWISYETHQGEIFDHLLAVLPEFGLRIFQRPSGIDMQDFGL